MYVFVRDCVRVCVDRRFTSHRGLHFPANRFNFTFSIELEFSLALAHSHSLSLSHSLSYNSRLFVFAVCPAVCLDFIFMATAQIHRQHLRRINWEARTLQFICINFIYFHLLYNSRIFFTHSTLLSYSFFALFASSSALPLRLISLAQTGKSR